MKFLKSKWLSAVIITALGWQVVSFINIKAQSDIVNKEIGELEDKVSNLEKSNSSLSKIIDYLKNPSFLDKEARLKLNYKSPEEEVAFVYLDDKNSSGSLDFNKNLAQMPNFLKWWHYLLGH